MRINHARMMSRYIFQILDPILYTRYGRKGMSSGKTVNKGDAAVTRRQISNYKRLQQIFLIKWPHAHVHLGRVVLKVYWMQMFHHEQVNNVKSATAMLFKILLRHYIYTLLLYIAHRAAQHIKQTITTGEYIDNHFCF